MPLLQLYLQPYLQGYPAFNNFPALYNASSTLIRLVYKDAMVLGNINNTEDILPVIGKLLDNIEDRIPEYLTAIGSFVDNFGDVQNATNPVFQEIKIITGY